MSSDNTNNLSVSPSESMGLYSTIEKNLKETVDFIRNNPKTVISDSLNNLSLGVKTVSDWITTVGSSQWKMHDTIDNRMKEQLKYSYPYQNDRYRSDIGGFYGGYDAAQRFPELKDTLVPLAAGHQAASAISRIIFDWNTPNRNIISKEYNDFLANREGIKAGLTNSKTIDINSIIPDQSLIKQGQEYADTKAYGKRPDGSQKGSGYFGELPRPDGKISTELSIQFDDVLGGKPIPLIVPTLTKKELDLLLSTPEKDTSKLPRSIIDKAIEHAKKRDAQGLSPFARPEDRINLPKK